MEKIIEKSIIGILIVSLISMGVYILPNDTHYSPCLNISMHCEKLSSSGLTCYPNTDTTKGKKYSSCGWQSIIKDTQENNNEIYTNAKQYLCNTNGECKIK